MSVREFVKWLAYYRIEAREQVEAQERAQSAQAGRSPRR